MLKMIVPEFSMRRTVLLCYVLAVLGLLNCYGAQRGAAVSEGVLKNYDPNKQISQTTAMSVALLHDLNPAQVWQGYDPRKAPLEIEMLREWEEDGSRFKEFYFTAVQDGNDRARIYAIYGTPADAVEVPALLHIHGGGQTAYIEWVKFWNKRGYAAMTFNWGGKWPEREKFAHYDEKFSQGNHREAGPKYETVDPNVRASSWYLWTLVSRRALTVLEQQPEVDAQRLGIFGISMGGQIVWFVSAFDERVKAACAIYCCGWDTYLYEPKYTLTPSPQNPTASILTWRTGMSSESYAPYIRCPVLYMSATNDFAGLMDRAYDTLAQIPDGVCRSQCFTPWWRHHIDEEQAGTLPAWMDTWLKKKEHLWPKNPASHFKLNKKGIIELHIKPDMVGDVNKVDFYYALEQSNPRSRYWRTVEPIRDISSWKAELPVMHADQYVFAFANIVYKSGICISSNLEAAVPDKLGSAKATDLPDSLIYDGLDGLDGWVVMAAITDPLTPMPPTIRLASGPEQKQGFALSDLNQSPHTHKIGDPKWRGAQGTRLSFKVFTGNVLKFTVLLHEDEYGLKWKKFVHEVSLEPAAGWQDISLSAEQFTEENGKGILSGWDSINMLEMVKPEGGWKDTNTIFTDFRWVK